jgi:ACS family tartrate transporter-like MFS transporter
MTPDTEPTLRRAARRLIPFLFVCYIVAYLDRINVSFAALHMNADLGLSPLAFGLGSGIFFLGYVLFEVPSNLILERVGPRRWIARIMVSWGLVSMAMAFVQGETSFHALRFLLGLAEAGFFPGIILYLTYWFPQAWRARAVALFMTATAVSGLIGSPISGAILGLHGYFGLAGWKWLFILEGLPAVGLGLAVLVFLPDHPDSARWLSVEERRNLNAQLAAEAGAVKARRLSESLRAPEVWLLAIVYLGMVVAMYGLAMWLPQMLKALTGASDLVIGFLAMIPYLVAALGMVLIGASSDRRGERKGHVVGALTLAMAGMGLAALAKGPVLAIAGMSLAALGIWGMLGPFWGLATSFLSGSAAAAGIALINAVGNVGGFLGPSIMGYTRSLTEGYAAGLGWLAGFLGLAALLTWHVGRRAG